MLRLILISLWDELKGIGLPLSWHPITKPTPGGLETKVRVRIMVYYYTISHEDNRCKQGILTTMIN